MTNKKEAEIYVHIPFCVRKCAYCDFLSFPAGEEQKEQYVNFLLHEIAAASEELRGRDIRSVFFGGGTPTVLPSSELIRILEMLYRCFRIRKDAEISVECNPGTADQEKLTCLRRAGVNRLSIGAQSFDDSLLKAIGRIHDSSQIFACYENARKAGFDNINLDLITALPGQTRMNWNETLTQAAELAPEHLSAYSLILEEETPLYLQRDSLQFPEEEEERAMYYDTADILSGYGYAQYEISNYAKPGKECLHNVGYWTGVEYKGLGLGASSYTDGKRYKNTDDPGEYARSCEHPENQYKEIQTLTDKDRMSEYLILGLRMTAGISLKEFRDRFGISINDAYPGIVKKYTDPGFLKTENDRLMFTREGISVSNVILSEFV